MDIMLPEGDGRAAARQLKDAPETARIPILAVTGLALEGEREKCLAAGCDGYLSKPFTPQQLRDTVVKVLDRPRS
jgi:two-component system cell cycle response regulator DivK